MDWLKGKEEVLRGLKKYRYVLAVLLAGLVLMALPRASEEELTRPGAAAPEEPSLQQELEELLSKVAGAGRVRVLLTVAASAETEYQLDVDGNEERTVVINQADRSQTGLIRQTLSPRFRGAVVLCQGADDARVKLAMVQAVMSATGLGADRITVLKME